MQLESLVKKQLIPWLTAERWFIGFSGGMDSTVLLHLVATWKKQQPSLPALHAIYIHHGLQEAAEPWPAHCQRICDQLQIPLTIIPVKVAQTASVEQAAREARYNAYNTLIGVNDVLLTAQHQRDQAETILFRLVRGTGVRGLAGIPLSRALERGHVVRPILDCSYESLQYYAKQHQLQWVEDPTNQEVDYARNYLRHRVLPVLRAQWPQAEANITQAATHLKEAQQLLDELALDDLKMVQADALYPWLSLPSLWFVPLNKLSWARQKNLLSHWLAKYTLLPATTHWQGFKDMLNAAQDAIPAWKLHTGILYRSAERLWWVPNSWHTKLESVSFNAKTTTITLPNNGTVSFVDQLSLNNYFIGYRQGGEVLRLAKRGQRDLKRLFNEQGIPIFMRNRIPLLFNEQHKLIAVANFPQWVDQDYQNRLVFKWQPATF